MKKNSWKKKKHENSQKQNHKKHEKTPKHLRKKLSNIIKHLRNISQTSQQKTLKNQWNLPKIPGKTLKNPENLPEIQENLPEIWKIQENLPEIPGKKSHSRPSPGFWPPPPAALLAAWDPELPRWPPREKAEIYTTIYTLNVMNIWKDSPCY